VGTVPTRWLGFHCTHVLGIGMVGCCLHAELIRTARNFIVAEGDRNVLVVEANRTPDDDEERLTDPDLYIYSDGASACVVTTDKPRRVATAFRSTRSSSTTRR
jgi:3-oxoacyl-[acyl-carrier-protein] synthase III